MSKNKLAKFADMAGYSNVVQCPFSVYMSEGFELRGRWHEDFFHNTNPIVLELGCGRGEYTVGLARRYPGKNFIGVDIKGARMWHGATEAIADNLTNVGFLRTNIEIIDKLFAENEVSEIWLTFSDPQQKNCRKRLTSTSFLERYRRFLVDDALVHVKTDSNFLATYTKYVVEKNSLDLVVDTFDLYADNVNDANSATSQYLEEARAIQTYYESMWLERQIPIKYILFRLNKTCSLEEPDVEIPVDGYRSYSHEVRSTQKTGK